MFEQTHTIKSENFKDKPSLPVYWAESISDQVLYLFETSKPILASSNHKFEIIMNLVLGLLRNKD